MCTNRLSTTVSMIALVQLVFLALPPPIGAQWGSDRTMDVTTSFGKIRGDIRDVNVMGGMSQIVTYFGIPYGTPPKGAKRFWSPQNAAKWTNHVKRANQMPPVCIQNMPDISNRDTVLTEVPMLRYLQMRRLQHFLRPANQNEDCLYMNLYVPVQQGPIRTKLPVLVLIHGDSYEWGSGNPYNATVLASYGQVIVVTINYRLGVFGFLSCGQPMCKGNWALSDILCSLQMIGEIIENFNGDPKRITLLGWGTGAALVNLLMSSPLSAPSDKRLFQRAILLGGSSLSPSATVKNPAEYFYRLATKLDCDRRPGTKNNAKPSKDDFYPVETILQCIRNHSMTNISKATSEIKIPSFLSGFGPVVDGSTVLTNPEFNMKNHGQLFSDLDLMVGLNDNEGFNVLNKHDLHYGMDTQRQSRIHRTLIRNLYQFHRNEILEALKTEYTNWRDPVQNSIDNRDGVMSSIGDALTVAPLVKTARFHKDGNMESQKQIKAKTYMYVFKHGTKGWQDAKGSIMGSVPGEDLAYILGYPLLELSDLLDTPWPYNETALDTEKMISMGMMRMISNFARNGDPLSTSSSNDYRDKYNVQKWLQFQRKENYLQIGPVAHLSEYYRADKVAFWNQFVPALNRAGAKEENIDEAHHFLPDHFSDNLYYGKVKPYGGFSILAYPPPPLPPPTMPPELRTTLANSQSDEAKSGDDSASLTPKTEHVNVAEYSTILSVTVAVGCALLVLNILIFAGIYHQRDKQKRHKKHLQMHYQNLADTTGSTPMNTGFPNSPLAPAGPRMPPAPPPPHSAHSGNNNNNSAGLNQMHPDQADMIQGPMTSFKAGDMTNSTGSTAMRTFQPTATISGHRMGPGHQHHRGFAEQEPLLGGPSTSTSSGITGGGIPGLTPEGTLPRDVRGISPTCPRHGRTLSFPQQQQQTQQVGTVEEIQV